MKMIPRATGSRCLVAGLAVLVMVGAPFRAAGEANQQMQAEPPPKAADHVDTWTADGGGGQSTGGGFSLTGTVGQPDAAVLSGCEAVLSGGIWAGPVDLGAVFCDGFEAGDTGAWSAVAGGE